MLTIITTDNKRMVSVGSSAILHALYSTVTILLKDNSDDLQSAIRFLKTGKCDSRLSQDAAKQINLIRDRLTAFSPDKAIYDKDNPENKAPWENNLSPIVTSCGNLFLTADGKDLLFELVSILSYSAIKKVSITVAD